MAAGFPIVLRRTASAGPLLNIPPPESTSVSSVVPKGALPATPNQAAPGNGNDQATLTKKDTPPQTPTRRKEAARRKHKTRRLRRRKSRTSFNQVLGRSGRLALLPTFFYVCDTLQLASKSTSEVLHSLHVGKVVTFNASPGAAMKGSWHVLGIFRRPNAGQWLVLVIASGLPTILNHVREFHVGSIATISDANLEITVEEASQILDQHLDAKKAIAAQSKASPSPTLKKVKVEVSSITPVSTAANEVKELQQTLDRFNTVCDRLEMVAGVAESLNESMTQALQELKKNSKAPSPG